MRIRQTQMLSLKWFDVAILVKMVAAKYINHRWVLDARVNKSCFSTLWNCLESAIPVPHLRLRSIQLLHGVVKQGLRCLQRELINTQTLVYFRCGLIE